MPEIRIIVVGARFRGPEAVAQVAALREGQEIALRREPDNKFDVNATACYFGDTHCGYIPARQNSDIARALDRGVSVSAIVCAPEQGREPPRIIVRWE
jgi:hypothetical protein